MIRHPFTPGGHAGAATEVLDHLGIREPVNWAGNAWGGQAGTLSAAAQTPLLPAGPDGRVIEVGQAAGFLQDLEGPDKLLARSVTRPACVNEVSFTGLATRQ